MPNYPFLWLVVDKLKKKPKKKPTQYARNSKSGGMGHMLHGILSSGGS